MVDWARVGEVEVEVESKGNFWLMGCRMWIKEDPVMTPCCLAWSIGKNEVAISWDKEGFGEEQISGSVFDMWTLRLLKEIACQTG